MHTQSTTTTEIDLYPRLSRLSHLARFWLLLARTRAAYAAAALLHLLLHHARHALERRRLPLRHLAQAGQRHAQLLAHREHLLAEPLAAPPPRRTRCSW